MNCSLCAGSIRISYISVDRTPHSTDVVSTISSRTSIFLSLTVRTKLRVFLSTLFAADKQFCKGGRINQIVLNATDVSHSKFALFALERSSDSVSIKQLNALCLAALLWSLLETVTINSLMCEFMFSTHQECH